MYKTVDIAILQAYIAYINNVNGVSEMRKLIVEISENLKKTAGLSVAVWLDGKAPQRSIVFDGWKEFTKRCGATDSEIENAVVTTE